MFSVTAAGLVCKHGPVNCRCAGSNKLPKLLEQPLATPHSHATTDPAGKEPPRGCARSVTTLPATP